MGKPAESWGLDKLMQISGNRFLSGKAGEWRRPERRERRLGNCETVCTNNELTLKTSHINQKNTGCSKFNKQVQGQDGKWRVDVRGDVHSPPFCLIKTIKVVPHL